MRKNDTDWGVAAEGAATQGTAGKGTREKGPRKQRPGEETTRVKRSGREGWTQTEGYKRKAETGE